MAHVNFLFWNIQGNNACLPVLADLVKQYAIDVLLLAECPFDNADVVKALDGRLQWVQHTNSELKFFSAQPTLTIINTQVDNHMILASLHLNSQRILLAGVHLPSKYPKADDYAQLEWAEYYRTLITEQEALISSKTYIFGDLNLNPYDVGMTHRTRGFTTVASQYLALRNRNRKVGKPLSIPRRYFYNPMWSFLGDLQPGTSQTKVPGTYHWSPKNPTDTHWNCLDGLLISPEGLAHFDASSLQIITGAGALDPLTGKKSHILFEATQKGGYSDHLPLRFTLINF